MYIIINVTKGIGLLADSDLYELLVHGPGIDPPPPAPPTPGGIFGDNDF